MPRHESRSTAASLQIRLDPTVPWEALLSRRIEAMAPSKRGMWIRALLVAGFREECGVRAQLGDAAARGWRQRAAAYHEPRVSAAAPPASTDQPAPDSPDQKPFAALAAVIG